MKYLKTVMQVTIAVAIVILVYWCMWNGFSWLSNQESEPIYKLFIGIGGIIIIILILSAIFTEQ